MVLRPQRGSPSLRLSLPSFPFFPPLFTASFLPSFLWQKARAVGLTEMWGQPPTEAAKPRCRAAVPSLLPVPPGPVSEWGSGSARSRKSPELIWFWIVDLLPAQIAHLLALQQPACGSLDSKNEVRSDSNVLPAGSQGQKGAGECKSERELKGHRNN